MSTGQKIIVTVSSFIITFITICTIFKSDISFLLTSRKIERVYGKTPENSYFLEDNYNRLDLYDKAEVHSKEDIINSIYYLINSGAKYSQRYCAKDYYNCYNDMKEVSNDTEFLSIINIFIHYFIYFFINSIYIFFAICMFNFYFNYFIIEIK